MKKKYLTLILGLLCGVLFAQSNIEITSPCDSLFINSCSADQVTLTATATTDCATSSFLVFNYQVDENNDGSIDLSGSSHEVIETFSLGEHRIVFTVTDECNSSVTCEYVFTLGDFEPPVATCLNGLATVIMPSVGSVTIWAEDFQSNSFDNCTASSDLLFSFSGDSLMPSMIVDCILICSGNNNVLPFNIYVIDEAGNKDSCITYILFQDPNVVCGFGCGAPPLPSAISVETIANCTFELDYLTCINGTNCNYNGLFIQPNLTQGDLISLEYNENPLNGVTTFDLVLITKHILGVQPLDSPFRELAADVNESGIITTFDIVMLRRLLLQIDSQLASGKSWIFSPDAQEYSFNIYDYEFTAIKLGDVNESATACLQGNIPSETRTLEAPLQLFTDNQFLQKGETYTIPIFAENYKDLLGGQFTMNFAKRKIRIDEVITGNLEAMSEENFGVNRLNEGTLLGSWAAGYVESLNTEEPVFELRITALENTFLKEVLEMNSSVLKAEVYKEEAGEYEFLDIQFDVLEKISGEIKAIPNPFREFTNISFTNEQEGLVELKVFDLSGKLIIFQNKNMEVGEQQIKIDKKDLPANGIYFYEIKTQRSNYSSKFILQ